MKKSIIRVSLLGLTLALTSCGDVMDEITSLVFDRNLSPISLEASVQQRTNVKLAWTTVNGATAYIVEQYDNDSLDFEGKTASATYTVAPSQVPYVVTGLEGETAYSFRVKSVTEGDESRDSKWSEVYVKTSTEQILNEIASADLKARQVTVTWPAGEAAKLITVTDKDGNKVEHEVTTDEIAAGKAVITGLTPETEYTLRMTRASGKTRGTLTFTTAIELADNDVLVKEGEDLAAAIAAAADGARLVVMPGTYTIAPSEEGTAKAGDVDINKSLTIKGLRPAQMPVINGRFTISGGKDIAFDQIVLDGTGTSGDQAFVFKSAGEYASLSITNSEVRNFSKGFYYINVAANVKKLTIDNCLIHDIECSGGDLFDSRAGAIQQLVITGNTIYKSCAERDFIRFDDASANFAGVAPVITVDHNTFDGVANSASRRILYIRFAGHQIAFTNNVVTNTEANFSNQSKTVEPTFKGNFYFNTPNLLAGGVNGRFFDNGGTVTNPGYKDAAKGDFTVTSEDILKAKAGAPRWIVAM